MEVKDSGNGERSSKNLLLCLSFQYQSSRFQLVQIQSFGKFSRVLLELLVDGVFDIIDRNFPCNEI